ncbi:MAG TPA: hypothetical protein VEB21_21285 [Terriglobales bacterium]|nr:hypothetical protein [Terriglobales bacterium]
MTKRILCLIVGLGLTLLAAPRAEANAAAENKQLITVWENVWQGSGNVEVAKADHPAPSYDDTQWTAIAQGSGSGESGCCQQGSFSCFDTSSGICDGAFFPGGSCDDNVGCVTEEPVCCSGLGTGFCVATQASDARVPLAKDCTLPCLGDSDCDQGFCDHGQVCKQGSSSVCTDTVHPSKCFLLGGHPVANSACQNDDGNYCGRTEPSESEFCCACGSAGPFANVCFEANTPSKCQAAGCEAVANAACDPISETCIPQGCQADSDCEDSSLCTIDSCDANDPSADNFGCVFTPKTCDDGAACNGVESCSELDGECVSGAVVICDDGNVCNGVETCIDPDGTCSNPDNLSCSDNSSCTTDSCDPIEGCVTTDVPDNTSCSDNACIEGAQCQGGQCTGGAEITCSDNTSCTVDSCDPDLGCVFNVETESAACGSCDDGLDNDDDGDADGEDCSCTTLCAQQRFAVVTTFVPNNFKRFAFYSGSDVQVENSPNDVPYPTGGICITNGDYRAGANIGFLATTGSSRFGKGAALDPDLVDEEGEDDIDTGSDRVTIIRESFASDGNPETFKDSPPYVGPGSCSQDAMVSCVVDADCGAGNDCTSQLTLTDMANTNVSRDGTADNYNRCLNAQATVDAEAAQIAAIAGTVPTLKGGQKDIKTSKSAPNQVITVGAGLQVIYVKRVLLAGKTTLTFQRDPLAVGPPTTLLIRVARQLRLGGQAEILLDGIDENQVIWNAEGTAGGRPKLLRASKFRGTLIASERRGVLVGGQVEVHGAIKARRAHIGQQSRIIHVPSQVLLP